MAIANLIKVKVYPRDFKSIPDILPYNKLLEGDPIELELDKKEIWRCMNFADVYDLTTGEEILIDEVSYKEIVEYVDEDSEEVEDPVTDELDVDTTVGEPLTEKTPVGPDVSDESSNVAAFKVTQ